MFKSISTLILSLVFAESILAAEAFQVVEMKTPHGLSFSLAQANVPESPQTIPSETERKSLFQKPGFWITVGLIGAAVITGVIIYSAVNSGIASGIGQADPS